MLAVHEVEDRGVKAMAAGFLCPDRTEDGGGHQRRHGALRGAYFADPAERTNFCTRAPVPSAT